MAQEFAIVFTRCDTDLHERGSCFAAFVFTTWLLSAHPLRCVYWVLPPFFWFSNPVLRPLTVQCSDSSLEPLLVDQPRNHDVPTPGVEWTIWLGMSVLSFRSGYSGAAALMLLCGFSAWCVRHFQFGQDLTRTLLYEALRARSSGFFVQVPSQARHDRCNYWRIIHRAVEQRDENACIGRECCRVQLRRPHAVRAGFALASNRGQTIRQSRRPRVPQSGPGRSAYCIIGGTSTQFPYVESTSKGITHSWSSVVGTPPLNVLHVPFWIFAGRDFLVGGHHQVLSHVPASRGTCLRAKSGLNFIRVRLRILLSSAWKKFLQIPQHQEPHFHL